MADRETDGHSLQPGRHWILAEINRRRLYVHVERAKGGMSYMSASDPWIHFGREKRTKIGSLEITWPSGQVDRLTNMPIDQIIAVKEGTGIVPRKFPKIVNSGQ